MYGRGGGNVGSSSNGLPIPIVSEMIQKLSIKAMEKYAGIIGREYTLEEISKHDQKTDCWIIVNDKVYDITEYLLLHPGGPNLIFKRAGQDATDDFEGMFHSRNAKAILDRFYIGKSKSTTRNNNLLSPSFNSGNNNRASPFLIPQQRTTSITKLPTATTIKSIASPITSTTTIKASSPIILSKVKIHKKEQSTNNTFHYLIELPEEHKHLEWISPLTHVLLTKHNENDDDKGTTSKENTFKSYTPIKQTEDKKYLEFLIKGYENGDLSKHIHQLKEGDHLLLKGPIQTSELFNYNQQQNSGNNYLLMIAGGTGITPMLQIIYETFSGANTNTNLKLVLIYSSNNENDIIYKDELDSISSQHKDRLFIHYVITKPTSNANQLDNLTFTKGRINEEMILTFCEPIIIKILPKMITDSMEVLVCGPLDFNKSISKELSKIGFQQNQIHILE